MSGGTWSDFVANWALFGDAAIAGAVAGAVLGLAGVFLVARRMVFFAAALSQCAALGATLGMVALRWWPHATFAPSVGAVLATALASMLPLADRGRPGQRRDAWLGWGFALGAGGTLVAANYAGGELHDIEGLLNGNAVVVAPEDFRLLAIVAGVVGFIYAWWHALFAEASFDPEGARIRGLPVRFAEGALWLTAAAAVGTVTRVLGALPAFGFSVLPAMAVLPWAAGLGWALGGALVLGAACGFGGYVVSYVQGWPVGATQVSLAVVVVLFSALGHGAVLALRRRGAPAAS